MLRLMLGATAIVQGIAYLSDYGSAPFSSLAIAVFSFLCGAFLLLGLMTPFAALVVFFGSLGIVASIIPAASYNLLASVSSAIYISVTAAVVAMLGAGAFSLDALMFGRREIVIPGKSNLPKS
jgi:uncharacterized membrane protein YphA (DoxX/SURF4 family)